LNYWYFLLIAVEKLLIVTKNLKLFGQRAATRKVVVSCIAEKNGGFLMLRVFGFVYSIYMLYHTSLKERTGLIFSKSNSNNGAAVS